MDMWMCIKGKQFAACMECTTIVPANGTSARQ